MGDLAIMLIVPLLLLIDFKQLFGYGWWGTLWRTLMAVPMSLLILKVLANFGRAILYLFEQGAGRQFWELILIVVDRAVLLWLLMEIVGVINRKEWHDKSWWHVVKRPVLVALVYLVVTVACYSLGAHGGLMSLYETYIGLMEP